MLEMYVELLSVSVRFKLINFHYCPKKSFSKWHENDQLISPMTNDFQALEIQKQKAAEKLRKFLLDCGLLDK